VLGEFAFTPAFSLPVRLFLEAKYYRTPCRLDVVRNAHGVVHDVNENFATLPTTRPRRRYQYSYALFSANGFTAEAQQYALAHQLSLVDLSGSSFAWLLESITTTARELVQAQGQYGLVSFPVTWMRAELRRALGTAPEELIPEVDTSASQFKAAALAHLANFAQELVTKEDTELLLGFPAAPFMLPLVATDRQRFLAYADAHPDHVVRIRRSGAGETAEWTVSPMGAEASYQLTFKLPEHIEDWISANEAEERGRVLSVKTDFLSAITIYRVDGSGVRTYHLRYEPNALRER
jgi:hypothetical protein